MGLTVLETVANYNDALNVKDQLVVIDFSAAWCGPCKWLSPKLAELAKEHSSVKFYKLDVDNDEFDAIVSKHHISGVPSVFFYKNGKQVAQVVGANLEEIKELVAEHK